MTALLERSARWFVAFSRSRRGAIIGGLIGIGLMALLILQLAREWRAQESVLSDAEIEWFLVGGIVMGGAALLAAVGWNAALDSVGGDRAWPTTPAFFLGQLGKYLPGGAWPYLGRGALAARAGVPLRTSGASFGVEIGAAVLVALLVAPLAIGGSSLGLALGCALSAALVLMAAWAWARTPGVAARRWFTRTMGGSQLATPALVRLTGLHVGAAALNGLSLWVTAFAFGSAPVSQIPLFIGAAALAWLIGFLVLLAPGGLGIREVVLVAIIGSVVGGEIAVALAVVSRLQLVIVDLVGASLSWLYLSGRALFRAHPDEKSEKKPT